MKIFNNDDNDDNDDKWYILTILMKMMNIIVFIAGFRDMYHDVYVHMDPV